MTFTTFDYYNQVEIPTFSLANPDGRVIYNLGTIYDRAFELRSNALSKLTFSAPSKIGDTTVDYYNYLQYKRLVLVEGIGEFVITGIGIDNNGLVEIKNITCESSEKNLSSKKISQFEGQYFLYAPGFDSSLLDELLLYIPGWTIGTVSDSLITTDFSEGLNRRFDVTDKTLYDFLVNEVSQTYQCIFVFDTINKIISAYDLDDATIPTDIFISFDNLMKSFVINESTEEVVTALTVLGGENLSINQVNPLGTNIIYNFDYYKNTEWMTQELIDAIDLWEVKTANYQQEYADNLTILTGYNNDMLSLNADLEGYNANLSAAEEVRTVQIQAGLPTTEVDAEIANLNSSIDEVGIEIDALNIEIENVQNLLLSINSDLSFENNFTPEELISLNNFIIGNTYTNVNFIQTTEMSLVDIQNNAQLLYNQARGIWNPDTGTYDGGILSKISQPRYTFEIDSANFLFLKDFEPFIEQLTMGCTVTIEIKPDVFIEAVLLGVDFSYDNPEQFKLILSNRLRLDDEEFQYTDLFNSVVDSSTTTNFNAQKWNSASDFYSQTSGRSVPTLVGNHGGSNICLYGNAGESTIQDLNALYVPPKSFPTGLLCNDGSTFTYSENYGYYTIIGRVCFFEVSLALATRTGAGGGQAYIQLPVVSSSSLGARATFGTHFNYVNLEASHMGVITMVNPSSASAGLWQFSDNGLAVIISGSNISSSAGKIYVSGNYIIK